MKSIHLDTMDLPPNPNVFLYSFLKVLQKKHKIVDPTPMMKLFVQEFLQNNQEYINAQQESETIFESK